MKDKVIHSFNRIALLEDKWDHNRQYEKLMLRYIDNGKSIGLDIGCGTGEFTKKLSQRVHKVLGIDLSPVMIEEAKKRHAAENIQYTIQDFDELDEDTTYDYIVSVATFHHLDLDTGLPKMKRLLKQGGRLIVLDLYERKGTIDYLLNCIAAPLHCIANRIKNKGYKPSAEEVAAWNEHSKIDHYMTFEELKNVYRSSLGNKLVLRRLLFWRYLMVYTKD